ncbi:MAG: hypothetical protein M3Z97_02725 [Candidatus Dormibacteraeota bacterium]|nr:hypothetical protein [Candidatus Dormibacteraeota bacterium]
MTGSSIPSRSWPPDDTLISTGSLSRSPDQLEISAFPAFVHEMSWPRSVKTAVLPSPSFTRRHGSTPTRAETTPLSCNPPASCSSALATLPGVARTELLAAMPKHRRGLLFR